MATNTPVIQFDVTDVEEDLDFYVGPEPKRGAYRAKLAALSLGESRNKDPMLTARVVITDGPYAGWAGWDRIVLTEAVRWKLAQLIRAIGAPQKTNSTKLLAFAKKQPALGILVGPDTDQNGNTTMGVNRLFPVSKLDEVASEVDDDDDDSAAEDLDETADDTADDADDAGDDDSTDDDAADGGDDSGELWSREELEELSSEDLRAVADEAGITYTKRTKDEAIVDKVLEAQGGEPDAGEGDDDNSSDDNDSVYTEDELKEMSIPQLKSVAEELGVESPARKPQLLIKQILEAQEAPF